MLKIVKFPDPILRETMPEFNFYDPIMDPKELEQQMLEAMYAGNGMGLAANQVGIRTRAFVMGHRDNKEIGQGLFNPQIVDHSDVLLDLEEGCLSFPGIYAKIKRPEWIDVIWQNSLGDWQNARMDGYACKCFLHEFDHLEGIVYKDRISTLKWSLANKKRKVYEYSTQ
jgi:peptide deformylase